MDKEALVSLGGGLKCLTKHIDASIIAEEHHFLGQEEETS